MLVERVGTAMGFRVKLGQFHVTSELGRPAWWQDALVEKPFQFVGYYFWADIVEPGPWRSVYVFSDLPRVLSQMPYPRRHQKKGMQFEVTEALRLGNICLNAGIPPEELLPAFALWRKEVRLLLEQVKQKYRVDTLEGVEWDINYTELGVPVEKSINGLLLALAKSPVEHWCDPKVDYRSLDESANVDQATAGLATLVKASYKPEDRMLAKYAGDIMAGLIAPFPRVSYVGNLAPRETHFPASMDNDGRPPPTAVWAADKPRKQRYNDGGDVVHIRVGGITPEEMQQAYEDQAREVHDDDAPAWGEDDPDYEEIDQQQAEDELNQGRWRIER